MVKVVFKNIFAAWVPVVVFMLDDIRAIKSIVETAMIPPGYRPGSCKAGEMYVHWMDTGTNPFAGMLQGTKTILGDDNLAAVLHMLKQRNMPDSIVMNMEEIRNEDPTLGQSSGGVPTPIPGTSDTSTTQASKDRLISRQQQPIEGRRASTATALQNSTPFVQDLTGDTIEAGRSTGSNNQDRGHQEKRTTKRPRHSNPQDEPNEPAV